METKKMQQPQIEQCLADLNQSCGSPWKVEQEVLCKRFMFADFNSAFAFMAALALHAEKVDHHPDWRNYYRWVELRMSTFDVDGLSSQDFDFANKAEQVAARLMS